MRLLKEILESWEWEWEFWQKNWESRMRMRVEIENETLDFSRMRVWLKLRVHFCRLLVMESLWLKHKNCNVILKKLPIKSTKINLDFSNFWELDNESWEWEFSQQIWESRSRMRREFSLRVSISRSRWESRRSLEITTISEDITVPNAFSSYFEAIINWFLLFLSQNSNLRPLK